MAAEKLVKDTSGPVKAERDALQAATDAHSNAMQKHAMELPKITSQKETVAVIETKLQAMKVSLKSTAEMDLRKSEDKLAKAKEREEKLKGEFSNQWKAETAAFEETEKKVKNAAFGVKGANDDEKASKEANFTKQQAAHATNEAALKEKQEEVRADAAQLVADRQTEVDAKKKAVAELEPEKFKAKEDVCVQKQQALDGAKTELANAKTKDEETAATKKVADAEKELSAAQVIAFPGQAKEIKALGEARAKLHKTEIKEAKIKADIDTTEVARKAASDALTTKEAEVRKQAEIDVTNATTEVTAAEEALKVAKETLAAAEEKIRSRAEDEKKAAKAAIDAKREEIKKQEMLALSVGNKLATAQLEHARMMNALAVAEGRALHPEHDTVETCMEAVINAQASEDLQSRLDHGEVDCDEEHEILAAQDALKRAKLKTFLSIYGKITIPTEIAGSTHLIQAKNALREAKERENAEVLPEKPKPNKDGTINLNVNAKWGKTVYQRVLKHVKLSMTIQHVMMTISEFPDDVGLGVDLTEYKLNWMEDEEGYRLPRNSTVEELELHQDQVIFMCHKEPASVEEDPSVPKDGPKMAAKYSAHKFKADPKKKSSGGAYGTCKVQVDVYDNPRLDVLGAQPHFGMHFTKHQQTIGHVEDRQTLTFDVHVDEQVGTIIEEIRKAANLSANDDIFLFHGEGRHEDQDPDRHIEGDDTRTAFWTRGDALNELFVDHIEEYGPNYVAVAKFSDGVVPYHGRWVNRIDYDSDELEHHGTTR